MRADWDTYFMEIATVVSSRSTCDRKHVGALLVRDRFAERRLVFSVGLDGRVDARSGLSFAHVKTVARKVFAP